MIKIRENAMGGTCCTYGEEEKNAHRALAWSPKGKRTLGRNV
jgi:hypothetical protein